MDASSAEIRARTGRGACDRCGATMTLGDAACVSCLLKEGLGEGGEASAEVFEAVLTEANVSDTQWHLGNYEVLEEIGRGGMGVIYRARQRHSRRFVALKRVLTYHADSHETLRRFRREAEAAASLDHPNILPIYEVSETEDGVPFFSMKLATGGSLRAAASSWQDRPRDAVRLMAKVARAIDYADAKRILHRDLQPGNILIDAHGDPMVSDFGLARWLKQESDLTRTLTTFGTPGYIAPEQAEDADCGATADIYSLGAILFGLLANRPPFVGSNALSVIRQAAAAPAPKLRSLAPLLSRDLETILERCLERDPSARYQTAGAFAEDLERCLDDRPILARPVRPPARLWRWSRRNPMLAGAAGVCLLLTGVVVWLAHGRSVVPLLGPVPEKSVAVLPFQNLTKDQEDSYFAVGIQDEILTDLAEIADLKVVSRTSTSSYSPGQPRNSRLIGEELGVAHLLEGSVQRIAHRVRINAQLIDTRTDSHLWAQTYDRDVADIFAIQSEIAKAIAEQLRSRISQREKAAIAEPPTTDLIAHELYLQAVPLELQSSHTDSMRKGIRMLEQAVARDPRFLRAYCALARLHLWLYDDAEHNAARLQAAIAAMDEAAQIQPDAGEVHLVRARYLSRALRDYDGARAELELARRTLPNDPALYYEGALMDRRQGRWAEALGNFDRALELDPRNANFLDNAAGTYAAMRRYARATELYRRELVVAPQDNECRLFLADISTSEWADIRPFRAELNALAAKDPGAVSRFAVQFWDCAILERDATAADRALAAMPPEGYRGYLGAVRPKEWYVGRTAHLFNRPDVARPAFAAASAIFEKHLREVPDDGLSWSMLGEARAALGQKQQAIAAGRHGCDVWPVSKEPTWGFEILLHLAKIYAAVGEKDLAIQQLSACAEQPCDTNYGGLKLNPDWDPLRGDPRFEKIVASLAPKNR